MLSVGEKPCGLLEAFLTTKERPRNSNRLLLSEPK
jgi:hypothetical protein